MPKKRLIRKQPLLERIRSYPLDLLLSINEQRLSIDWDSYVPQCLPMGSIVSLVFLILCKIRNHYISVNEKRDNSVFRSDYSTYQQVVSRAVHGAQAGPIDVPRIKNESVAHTLLWTVNVMLIFLFATSLINAVNVYFFPYKSYTLLSRSTDTPKPKGSCVTEQNVSNTTPRGFFQNLFSYFEEHSYYETDVDSDADTTYEARPLEKDVWMLSVWDPSHFSLYAAASFSPIVLLSVWLFSSSVSFWKVGVFVLLSNACAVYLTSKFLELISDKQIIYQETFSEYNKKYVIPKTSVLRKNASIDATHGPYAPASKTVHDDPIGYLQNELAFVTHDINGTRLKSVRADYLDDVPSRPVSPSKHLSQNSSFLPPASSHGSRYDTSMRSLGERPSYYDDTTDRHSQMMSSTPFAPRNAGNESFLQRPDVHSRGNEAYSRGYDSFSRTSSRPHSPLKSPSRLGYNPNLSYNERTQLSPSRSSRHSSPQRSPSPSKRSWH
ncbi:hypothetical protein JCM33374_g687 [Metschnikowia sp. JCM 33374]|nr:hypothetical protein JCM33374_g687 [Metschnikowia sp. JCM 33374]